MMYKIKKINNFIYSSISYNVGNIYLLVLSVDEIAIIDTGAPATLDRIVQLLYFANFKINNIKIIFITHADGDHIGNLGSLLKLNPNIIVYAHYRTWSYIDSQKMPKHFPWFIELLLNYQIRKYCTYKIKRENRLYLTGSEYLDIIGGIRVINTPGHTDDHISFFLEQHKILFSGDVIVNVMHINKPPNFVNNNTFLLYRSYDMLMSLKPRIICCGHGDILLV